MNTATAQLPDIYDPFPLYHQIFMPAQKNDSFLLPILAEKHGS